MNNIVIFPSSANASRGVEFQGGFPAGRVGLLIDVASGRILRTADEIGFDGHEIYSTVPMHRNRIALMFYVGPFRVGGGGPKARQPTMVDRESTTTRL